MKTDKRSILSLIVFRLIVVTTLLAAAVIVQMSTSVFLPLGPFYLVILAAYGLTLIFLLLYKYSSKSTAQGYIQIIADILIITALVYISGGLSGNLYVLYVLPILAAAVVLGGRAPFLIAALSAIFFGALADGMYYGLIPYFRADQFREIHLGLIFYTIFLAWALFFILAALFSFMGRRLGQTREALDRAQRELRLRERLAEAGKMSALIAHEIRNPLAAISGAVQVLKGDLSLEGEQARLMDIVVRESRRVSMSIDDFLNLAAPGSHDFVSFRLADVLRDTLTMLYAGTEIDDRIAVLGNYETSPIVLYGDPNQFRQIFWNLLRNAVRAMPDGGRLAIDFVPDGEGGVLVSIADSGRGMTAEEKEKIFEPFFSTFSGGRGLGLAVVRRIIEDYEGTISVESEPGQGTIFSLRLPARRTPAG